MNVVFRVDASVEIGTGHVMRCLTLADALLAVGTACTFLCRRQPGDLADLISSRGFPVRHLRAADQPQTRPRSRSVDSWLGVSPEVDAAETLACLDDLRVDILVVDHYAISAAWERMLRPRCRTIFVVDDLADRPHECDLLLDMNFGRTQMDYEGLVPADCRVLAGTEFVLLRPEFAAYRAQSLARPRPSLREVLISMGGMDKDNVTLDVLNVLDRCALPQDCRITVVMGARAPWLEAVRERACRMPRSTRVLVNVENMACLMAGSDLAIGSGGGGTYERIFMGLPSVVRPIAENQEAHLERMARAGLFTLWRDASSLEALLTGDLTEVLRRPSDVVRNGVEAVVHTLLGPPVELRTPVPLDVRRTYRWLQDDGLRVAFLMRVKPARRKHIEHWRAVLQAAVPASLSIYVRGKHIGNAGFKPVPRESRTAELWMYIGAPSDRGRGIGAHVVRPLEDRMRQAGFRRSILHVSRKNVSALRLYLRCGYRECHAPDVVDLFGECDVIRMEKIL